MHMSFISSRQSPPFGQAYSSCGCVPDHSQKPSLGSQKQYQAVAMERHAAILCKSST